MLLMGLVFALIGIKLFGFRRRLTFERSQVQQQQSQQAQQPPPRYAAFESQVRMQIRRTNLAADARS